ncbi:MAG TPA: GNAT family N-acetyltransferase [Rhodocyclaceae bacterium]|nr:GNAT family N-acetyltransferase [Rhodocyclaceae bacterium]
MHTTPLLVDVRQGSFEDYIGGLAKTGKKNYRYVEKNNADLEYVRISFDRELVARFMDLWSQQDIEGSRREWGLSMGFLEYLDLKGQLLCFAARRVETPSDVLAVHFVERHGDYVYCHPPMYSKDVHSDRYIAKYMWFGLIRHALGDPGIAWLDLGGGNSGTWRDLLRERDQNAGYKWLYVSEAVKKAPEEAPPYTVQRRVTRYELRLVQGAHPASPFGRWLSERWISFFWLNRGRWGRKLYHGIRRRLLPRAKPE